MGIVLALLFAAKHARAPKSQYWPTRSTQEKPKNADRIIGFYPYLFANQSFRPMRPKTNVVESWRPLVPPGVYLMIWTSRSPLNVIMTGMFCLWMMAVCRLLSSVDS